CLSFKSPVSELWLENQQVDSATRAAGSLWLNGYRRWEKFLPPMLLLQFGQAWDRDFRRAARSQFVRIAVVWGRRFPVQFEHLQSQLHVTEALRRDRLSRWPALCESRPCDSSELNRECAVTVCVRATHHLESPFAGSRCESRCRRPTVFRGSMRVRAAHHMRVELAESQLPGMR